MLKQKLIQKRKEKGFSQADMAHKMNIDTSGYSRREHGVYKISKKEWDKMAKILDTTLEEIYEPQDGIYIINNGNENENFGNYHNYSYSDFALETLKKHIDKLEKENINLREENIRLREKE